MRRIDLGVGKGWRGGDDLIHGGIPGGPDLSLLSHDQKDALITGLMAQVAALTARVTELEAKLGLPSKTPDNSSLPPSKGQKASAPSKTKAKANPHAGAQSPAPSQPDARADSFPRSSARAAARTSLTRRRARFRSTTGSRSPEVKPDVTRVKLQRRRLPLLRRALQGGRRGGPGAGLPVRAEPSRLRDLSALGPGHPDGAADRRPQRSQVHNHFNQERQLVTRRVYEQRRSVALAEWRALERRSSLARGHVALSVDEAPLLGQRRLFAGGLRPAPPCPACARSFLSPTFRASVPPTATIRASGLSKNLA